MGACAMVGRREAAPTSPPLQMATLDTHPEFTLEGGGRVPAKLVKIYDGDTAWLSVDAPVKATFRVRLLGIDTPELRQPAARENREALKRQAYAARNRLAQLATNAEIDLSSDAKRAEWDEVIRENSLVIYAVFGAPDKYGRALATLYRGRDDQTSLNEILIQENHAVAYDGGTKQKV